MVTSTPPMLNELQRNSDPKSHLTAKIMSVGALAALEHPRNEIFRKVDWLVMLVCVMS
jgi:hypothetical protein